MREISRRWLARTRSAVVTAGLSLLVVLTAGPESKETLAGTDRPSTPPASAAEAARVESATAESVAAAPADTKPSAPSPGIQRVGWLAGCWEMSVNGRTVEEHWMAPRGKNMLNMGRTMKGDALVEFEQVVLREEGDRLAYEAHPAGQPSAVFMSATVGDGSVVFENPKHDFPQRVGYERKGDSLLGWIEGTRDGKVRRIEFPYKRVPCPGN